MTEREIIITGVGGNIGGYLAGALLKEGHGVTGVCRTPHETLNDFLRQYPSRFRIWQADIRHPETLSPGLAEFLEKRAIIPGSLIHCAAVRSADFSRLTDTEPDAWERVIDVNLLGTYHLLRATIPLLRRHPAPRILLFGSNVSRHGLKHGSAYAASKAAVASLARTIAREEPDILINTLSPGPVRIDHSHFDAAYSRFRDQYYEQQKRLTALGRIAEPSDLLGICRFLVSEENTYITGEEIFIDGGR